MSSDLRILIAEDHESIQIVTQHVLRHLGYRHVDTVGNGRAVVEVLRTTPYDVILMDLMMPVMSGIDAARYVCEHWPADERPTIVAVTADASPTTRQRALEAGIDLFLAKPISAQELGGFLSRIAQRNLPKASTALPSLPDAPTLDHQVLRELLRDICDRDTAVLDELIADFLIDTRDLIGGVRRAIQEENAEQLRKQAHTLKSSSALFGARALADVARWMEDAGRADRLADAAATLSALQEAFGAASNALEQASQTLQASAGQAAGAA